ncbi:hypothetical protein OG338_11305 [Streptomyces sp. NBC_00726]
MAVPPAATRSSASMNWSASNALLQEVADAARPVGRQLAGVQLLHVLGQDQDGQPRRLGAVVAVAATGHTVNTFMWVRAVLLPVIRVAFLTRITALRAAFAKAG